MIDYAVDADGIATLTWNMTEAGTNVLSDASTKAFEQALDKALADDAVKGIIITSARKDFLAGADLGGFLKERDAGALARLAAGAQAMFRRMETGGKPVVAAINGTALGGGLELALACHRRIAADNPKTRIGLPEVTMGLLPGAGGTQRLPRLIGIHAAVPLLVEGTRLDVRKAQEAGIIDEVVPAEALLGAAKKWLASGPEPVNPWDKKGFRPPGGDMSSTRAQEFFTVANSMLRQKTYGNYPAPEAILSCVHDGIGSPIDVGLRIEAKYFGQTAATPQCQSMIKTLFFAMGDANKLKRRPKEVPQRVPSRIGVLGSGLMGQGIGHVTAQAGIEVVLIDSTREKAEAAKARSDQLLQRNVDKGRMTAGQKKEILDRLHPGTDYAALEGCELVIEAVFENRAVKAEVTQKAAQVLADDAVFASNTSTLPISGLAQAYPRPENFIGLHFFSPVHRMALLEIIRGEQTSDACLAWSLDYARAIRKTPIVVNDGRGFYTSRVVSTFADEGLAMLVEGVKPGLIENGALMCGMPMGPLALSDEVQIDLFYKIRKQWMEDLGDSYDPGVSFEVAKHFVEDLNRPGKAKLKGFYDHNEKGERHLWPGLAKEYPAAANQPDVEEVQQRFLYIQALEAARTFEEGIVTAPADADIGSILGWGFPAWTGGALSLIDQIGAAEFVTRCQRLADRHGERFVPPKLLLDLAASGDRLAA